MIPVRLALSNFMPYRGDVPPLDFTGIHIASICGDNGAGKSSLIDAMTWALWGRTRARSDDDLIHAAESQMQVQFDFAVGTQLYRIIRKHGRPKSRKASGPSSLDLYILQPKDGAFRPISGDRIGETQQKIIDILHMDYDTFINSAFLRQGHADQFTVARPAERKAVLASILGLSTYDTLAERAKTLAGKLDDERAQLQSAIETIDRQLASRPAYEAEMARVQAELDGIDRQAAEAEARLAGLRQQREALTGKQQQLAQLDQQTEQAARGLARWQEQAGQHRQRLREYETLLARQAEIEAGYAGFVAARKSNEEFNQKLRAATGLNDKRHQLEMAVLQASQALVKAHAIAEGRISDFETTFGRLPGLRNDAQTAAAALAQLDAADTALRDSRQDAQDRLAAVRQLEADLARLQKEIAEIDDKLALLLSGSQTRCPLCGQELDSEHLALIKAKYTEDKQAKLTAVAATQADLTRGRSELARCEIELAAAEGKLKQARTAAQARASLGDQEIARALEAGSHLEKERASLGQIEEQMARKDYAAAEQQALRQVEAQAAALAYDSAEHDQVRQRLATLEQYEAPKNRLDEAARMVEPERAALARSEQAASEMAATLEADNQRKATLLKDLAVLPSVSTALAAAETEYAALGGRQKQAREALGVVRERLNRCAQLDEERREKARQFDKAVAEAGVYGELAESFGRNGVQALLIELALPELEIETNRLLARMTDNRMHVKFETQRETKKGEAIETLDINIADELGTRPYEMFSGGEAFRINFAIRIALSKLLARRAGAPLPTLIIDEGFGTQDAAGMEKLREAITSIQDDFEKILVITHIDEFREAFPARIEVVKTPDGSTIEVS